MNTPIKMTLNEEAERYLATLDIKPTSRETYKRSVIELIRYTASIGNPEPSREVLLGFKQSLINSGKSENTVNTYLIVANSYYKWMAEEGIIPAYIPPVKGIKMHARSMRHDALTPAQAYAILNADAPKGTIGGELAKARDEAIISLGIHTGLREISISNLTCGDLRNKGDKTVLYYLSKGHYSKDAYVIVIPEVANKIYDYLAMRGTTRDDAPLFASTSNRNKNGPMGTHAIATIIRKYIRMMGIKNPRVTPHSAMRHTAGTLALMGGASVKECANMLDHVDSTTTERFYLHDLTRMQGIGEEAIASVLRQTAEGITLNEGNHTPVLTEVTQ